MIKSMTGFGSKQARVAPFSKICVELRSSNHKFLETVFHLPPGLLSLEDRLKREIESKIKRGRVVCAINITGGLTQGVFINKELLKDYISAAKNIKGRFAVPDELSINTLIQLPGIFSLAEDRTAKAGLWPHLKRLVHQALEDLVKARQKEGRALYVYLKSRAEALKVNLEVVRIRFKKVVKERMLKFNTDEERTSFLKDTDIAEEIERIAFHIRNFSRKLSGNGAIGKELDFIAQEMQREANTMAAKSCDALISSNVVQMKSQIEKIREQVQNIE